MPFGAMRHGFTFQAAEAAADGRPVDIDVYGNAQISTAQSKFGGSSGYFDGNGDTLETASPQELSAGEWTMECWARADSYPTSAPLIFDPRGSSGALFRLVGVRNVSGAYKIGYFLGSWNVGTTTLSTNTWYHLAWVYDGSNVKMYVNGNLEATISETGTFVDTVMTIASYQDDDYYWDGYLDEIRVSSVARYSGNFTAPTSAFSNDADTELLIHADGTNGSTNFVDDASEPSAWISDSAIEYDYAQYQNQNLQYAGDDSSGRPCFLWGYMNSGVPSAILLRRNSDGTISKSTEVVVHANGNNTTCVVGENNGGDLIGVQSFAVGSGSYARAYQLDLNNLSIGTVSNYVTIEGSGNTASFSYSTYMGDGRFAVGGRGSGGIRQRLITVSGTTISVSTGLVVLPVGDGVYQTTRGMVHTSGSYYRFIACNGNDGKVAAGYFRNTTAGGTATLDLSTLGLAFRSVARLDGSTKGAMITSGSSVEIAPFSVSWPSGSSTGSPSITSGTNITLASGATNANLFDGIDDSLMAVYRGSDGDWYRQPITSSGIALTAGTAVNIDAPSGYYGHPYGQYVSTSQGNVLMLIMDIGSGADGVTIYSEVV